MRFAHYLLLVLNYLAKLGISASHIAYIVATIT